MDTTSQRPKLTIRQPRAFTLVELLVVITIIGILASLITVAAVGALRQARQAEIKTEIDQIATALETYKDDATSYPPNCQTDGTATDAPLDELTILNDMKRHMKQAFPRHQESENLIRALVGLTATGSDAANYPRTLAGGMSAGEALVFWLGGFSSDPKYPISGEGGPAYPVTALNDSKNATLDPIESRKWTYPFDVGRLAPRDADGFFDQSSGNRYIEYIVTINGEPQRRRLNFWQYAPRRSEQPYLYFDTSRNPPTAASDPPAATELSGLGPSGQGLHVHAFKKLSESANSPTPVQYVNPDKFQVMHCGLDEDWDEEAFERMSPHGLTDLNLDPTDPADYLLYPDGPFIGEIADTIVNFTTATRIEDAQP